MYDLASSAIAGCGQLSTGLARGQASKVASSASLNTDLISCSSAWTRLETAQERLMELTRMYGQMAAANGIAITVAGYGRLYSFIEAIIDGACPSNTGVQEAEAVTGGARRRKTYKKRKGKKSPPIKKSAEKLSPDNILTPADKILKDMFGDEAIKLNK